MGGDKKKKKKKLKKDIGKKKRKRKKKGEKLTQPGVFLEYIAASLYYLEYLESTLPEEFVPTKQKRITTEEAAKHVRSMFSWKLGAASLRKHASVLLFIAHRFKEGDYVKNDWFNGYFYRTAKEKLPLVVGDDPQEGLHMDNNWFQGYCANRARDGERVETGTAAKLTQDKIANVLHQGFREKLHGVLRERKLISDQKKEKLQLVSDGQS